VNRTRKIIIALSVASFLWCAAVGMLFWFPSLGGQSFASISAYGPAPLIIPVLLAAVGAWSAHRGHRIVLVVATAVTTLYAFITGFSIGPAYLPAVVALVAASIVALSASRSPLRAGAGKSGAAGKPRPARHTKSDTAQ
jgi:hypothetical protein